MPEQFTGRILITGGAGFIGSHIAAALLRRGCEVAALDNFDDYYDPAIKRGRWTKLDVHCGFQGYEADICDGQQLQALVKDIAPQAVIHLAARAGVRPSWDQPEAYARVNVQGTSNLLEAVAAANVERVLFASSSSVYGDASAVPFSEDDRCDRPISPYAATKRAGEMLCYTFHHRYGTPITCLRFFTVFGPGQRPDLAIQKFLTMVDAGKQIPVFGSLEASRDYTFVTDIAAGVLSALDRCDGYNIFNLGSDRPVTLADLIKAVEKATGKEARLDRQPHRAGDVKTTWADLSRSKAMLDYSPQTSFEEGIARQFREYDWLDV